MNKILELLALALGSPIIKLVIWSVVVDTFFGFIRAIKEHKFNSSALTARSGRFPW